MSTRWISMSWRRVPPGIGISGVPEAAAGRREPAVDPARALLIGDPDAATDLPTISSDGLPTIRQ
jgi:hypothetical protein